MAADQLEVSPIRLVESRRRLRPGTVRSRRFRCDDSGRSPLGKPRRRASESKLSEPIRSRVAGAGTGGEQASEPNRFWCRECARCRASASGSAKTAVWQLGRGARRGLNWRLDPCSAGDGHDAKVTEMVGPPMGWQWRGSSGLVPAAGSSGRCERRSASGEAKVTVNGETVGEIAVALCVV